MAARGLVDRFNSAVGYFRAHPRLTHTLEVLILALTLGLCAWAVAGQWSKAAPLLEHANLGYLGLAVACVTAYYLVFILGWIRMLAAWRIDVAYRPALQAEMVSMLAKYLPGGVWTPAARTVALRRSAGVTDTPVVLASILVEAGLSAISGVIVFVVSLAWVNDVDAPPLWALIGFASCSRRSSIRASSGGSEHVLAPFGTKYHVDPLPFPVTLVLLLFYCGTWLVGGLAVYFMLRSLGDDVALSTIPYLGGVSAIGAIVAVLTVFLPSGLGVREASMYGLLHYTVTSSGAVALGVTVLNRLIITLVEVALFAAGWSPGAGGRPRR